MSNQTFVIGHVHYEGSASPNADHLSHVWGAVLNPSGAGRVVRSGVTFGTRSNFDADGHVANKTFSHLTFLPISAASADRFTDLVGKFRQLHTMNRLPFYFSRERLVYTCVEGKPDQTTNLEGKTEDIIPWRDCRHTGRMVKADGKIEANPDLINPPGLKRVRANCTEMFNFMAQRSGIDLTKLDQAWWNKWRGRRVEEFYRTHFRAATFGLPGFPDLVFNMNALNGLSIPHVIPHVQLKFGELEKCDPGQTRLKALLAGHVKLNAESPKTIHEAVEELIADQPALEMDPWPLPDYVQNELTAAGLD